MVRDLGIESLAHCISNLEKERTGSVSSKTLEEIFISVNCLKRSQLAFLKFPKTGKGSKIFYKIFKNVGK